MTVEQAARFIARAAWPGEEIDEQEVIDDLDTAVRLAAKHLHPDAGGSTEDFQRLQAAKEVVERHG